MNAPTRDHASRATLWGASFGALVGYTAAALLPFIPALSFFPRLGSWAWESISGEPSIRWYGWLLYGVAGALLGMACGRLIRARVSWGLLGAVSILAWLLLSWHERGWFRQ